MDRASEKEKKIKLRKLMELVGTEIVGSEQGIVRHQ